MLGSYYTHKSIGSSENWTQVIGPKTPAQCMNHLHQTQRSEKQIWVWMSERWLELRTLCNSGQLPNQWTAEAYNIMRLYSDVVQNIDVVEI